MSVGLSSPTFFVSYKPLILKVDGPKWFWKVLQIRRRDSVVSKLGGCLYHLDYTRLFWGHGPREKNDQNWTFLGVSVKEIVGSHTPLQTFKATDSDSKRLERTSEVKIGVLGGFFDRFWMVWNPQIFGEKFFENFLVVKVRKNTEIGLSLGGYYRHLLPPLRLRETESDLK